MMVRYDNETLIPLLISPGARESGRCGGSEKEDVKVEMEEQ